MKSASHNAKIRKHVDVIVMSFPASFFYSKCTFPSSVSRWYKTKVPSGIFGFGFGFSFGFVGGPRRSDEDFGGCGGGDRDEGSVGGGFVGGSCRSDEDFGGSNGGDSVEGLGGRGGDDSDEGLVGGGGGGDLLS